MNYKFRMHNPRLGRFFAVDPLTAGYPHNSPYAFSENRVIDHFELEGLEALHFGFKFDSKDAKTGVVTSFFVGISWNQYNNTVAFELINKESGTYAQVNLATGNVFDAGTRVLTEGGNMFEQFEGTINDTYSVDSWVTADLTAKKEGEDVYIDIDVYGLFSADDIFSHSPEYVNEDGINIGSTTEVKSVLNFVNLLDEDTKKVIEETVNQIFENPIDVDVWWEWSNALKKTSQYYTETEDGGKKLTKSTQIFAVGRKYNKTITTKESSTNIEVLFKYAEFDEEDVTE